MTFPLAFPCSALNAGGAGDASRYSLPRIVALAESLARGVVVDAGPLAITERQTGSKELLAMFDAILPQSSTDKGKARNVTLCVPGPDGDGVDKVVPVQTIRDALAGLVGQTADFAVVNGTSRTLALVLLWACGITAPTLPTVMVEGTDAELRDLSAKGNLVQSYAKAMAYNSRILYALTLTDMTGPAPCLRESELIKRAGVGRGIGQEMFAAATAIRQHKIKPDADGNYPKLDKTAWAAVVKVPAGQDITAALSTGVVVSRDLTLKLLGEKAKVAPAGPAGDVLRAIA